MDSSEAADRVANQHSGLAHDVVHKVDHLIPPELHAVLQIGLIRLPEAHEVERVHLVVLGQRAELLAVLEGADAEAVNEHHRFAAVPAAPVRALHAVPPIRRQLGVTLGDYIA